MSLATVDGRIEADCVLPDAERDTPHAEHLFSDEYETTGASYTTATVTGCSISISKRKWCLKHRQRQPFEMNRLSTVRTPSENTLLTIRLVLNQHYPVVSVEPQNGQTPTD
jgi:hypothetical protein